MVESAESRRDREPREARARVITSYLEDRGVEPNDIEVRIAAGGEWAAVPH